MKSEETFDSWKRQKRQVEVREDFTDGVISRIYKYEQNKRKPLFDVQNLIKLISAHPLAQAALILAGSAAGIIRVVFIVSMILE